MSNFDSPQFKLSIVCANASGKDIIDLDLGIMVFASNISVMETSDNTLLMVDIMPQIRFLIAVRFNLCEVVNVSICAVLRHGRIVWAGFGTTYPPKTIHSLVLVMYQVLIVCHTEYKYNV